MTDLRLVDLPAGSAALYVSMLDGKMTGVGTPDELRELEAEIGFHEGTTFQPLKVTFHPAKVA